MNRQRRLWMQATGPLLEELIGVHQRVHAAFGHKLGRPCAFPLFQGKRRNRTIIYNAEYDGSGKLRRGVFFVTTGTQVDGSCSEQWSIGRGWRSWSVRPGSLERLSGRIYDAVRDEFNLDLAPLKMPFKLVHWVDDLAAEFAQRNGLPPDHPQVDKCLRQIFLRGGHQTVESGRYELPHQGLGGLLVAYALAACRQRVDRHWLGIYSGGAAGVQQWSKAPQLWIHFSPEAREGAALGFPRPPHPSCDAPGGIQLAVYPRPGTSSGAEIALSAVTRMPVSSVYEVVASFPAAAKPDRLTSWSELLETIAGAGPEGSRIWNLAQPETMATAREAIKAWDHALTRWSQALKRG